ncbi:MAG: hypothetical protein IIW21_02370 [Clostridia bacterium]|nr:hypothetical protein [Clostridia bacterium]
MNAEKLTKNTIKAFEDAQRLSAEYGNPNITPLHLIYALAEPADGLIRQLFISMNINGTQLVGRVLDEVKKLPRVSGSARSEVSAELSKALAESEKCAEKMGDSYVSVEHIMLALIKTASGKAKEIFSDFGITEDGFLTALKAVRGNRRADSDTPEDCYDALKKYGQDLVALARAQKLDPVIGRDEEIRSVIRILSRKSKNNPCLIGEPGVGKTAIAEGLAQRIVRGDVPENLRDRTVFSLDTGLRGNLVYFLRKKTLHYRETKPVVFGMQLQRGPVVKNDDFIYYAARAANVPESTIKLAKSAFFDAISYFVMNGRAVQVEGLGTFSPQVKAKSAPTEEELTTENIRQKRIYFTTAGECRRLTGGGNINFHKNVTLTNIALTEGVKIKQGYLVDEEGKAIATADGKYIAVGSSTSLEEGAPDGLETSDTTVTVTGSGENFSFTLFGTPYTVKEGKMSPMPLKA